MCIWVYIFDQIKYSKRQDSSTKNSTVQNEDSTNDIESKRIKKLIRKAGLETSGIEKRLDFIRKNTDVENLQQNLEGINQTLYVCFTLRIRFNFL